MLMHTAYASCTLLTYCLCIMHTAYAACKYDDCASTALTMQDLWLNPDYLLRTMLGLTPSYS